MHKFFILALLVIIVSSCQSCKPEKKPVRSKIKTVEGTITGMVRMKGNMPHPSIVIAGSFNQDNENHTYIVVGDKSKSLRNYLYKKVEAKGIIKMGNMRLAGNKERHIPFRTIRVKEFKVLE